jgi:L-fucose mutarotase
MLTIPCINPELVAVLAQCGHGDRILIADGNYPLKQKTGKHSQQVYLSVRPGLPAVTDVLSVLHAVCNFERAEVMMPDTGEEPAVFAEFRKELHLELSPLERYAFYDACCRDEVCLAINTGEQRVFANILLTVGCA